MLAAFLLWLALTTPARAHLTPNSEVRLDFGRNRVEAELVIPLGELGYAMGTPFPPDTLNERDRARIVRYLTANIAIRATDGRPWALAVGSPAVTADGFAPDLVAKLTASPPPGAPVRVFDLHYAAVIAQAPNHFVFVLARNDFAGGRLSDRPAMIGGLQSAMRDIRVDRGPGSAWRGFVSAIGLGIHHIWEGHDHLLFLIALLIPAPLTARGRRWREYRGLRATARQLAMVVTAFTVGHSLTLIGGAFFGWKLPAQPVEIMIALSILISALHSLRPIFPGREAVVAAGFGLVHGLAFATLIGRFGLEPLQKAQSILGFNLGIELVQLGVIAAVMPGLILLAQTPAYPAFRIGAGLSTAAAALAWMAERTTGTINVAGRAVDDVLSHGPWLVAALTLVAAAIWWRRSRSPSPRSRLPEHR